MEKQNPPNKPHVLALPVPAQGHINPMLQFSKRLVYKGAQVTLANSIYISKTMHSDPNSPIFFDTVSDGFDEGGYAQAESPEAYSSKFKSIGSKTLAQLINKLAENGRPVDALVYDSHLPWALDVAKEFGLVGAALFTQAGAVNNIYYHAYERLISLPLSGSGILIPGIPLLEPWEMPSFIYFYGAYPGYYDMVVNQFSNIDEADWVLFNTFYELEEEVVNWMAKHWRVRTIGPTVPSMYLDKQLQDDKDYGINLFKPNSAACMNWLNSKPTGSVVYIAFGSMAQLEAQQMEEIAWGIKETNFYFLWVVRASEEEKLPNKFIEETSEKGLIVNWSPQLDVLAHEAIGCFVTHCGFNSVLEAISLGVPVVAVPQWTDQTTNAKLLVDVWGMGIRTRPDEKGIVERELLESCVREVMEGEKGKEIKKKAIKWKNLAKDAVDKCGSSDKNIEEFVAELVHSKTSGTFINFLSKEIL